MKNIKIIITIILYLSMPLYNSKSYSQEHASFTPSFWNTNNLSKGELSLNLSVLNAHYLNSEDNNSASFAIDSFWYGFTDSLQLGSSPMWLAISIITGASTGSEDKLIIAPLFIRYSNNLDNNISTSISSYNWLLSVMDLGIGYVTYNTLGVEKTFASTLSLATAFHFATGNLTTAELGNTGSLTALGINLKGGFKPVNFFSTNLVAHLPIYTTIDTLMANIVIKINGYKMLPLYLAANAEFSLGRGFYLGSTAFYLAQLNIGGISVDFTKVFN